MSFKGGSVAEPTVLRLLCHFSVIVFLGLWHFRLSLCFGFFFVCLSSLILLGEIHTFFPLSEYTPVFYLVSTFHRGNSKLTRTILDGIKHYH